MRPTRVGGHAGHVHCVEEWRDRAALDAHLNSSELRDALAHADQLFIEGGISIHPLKEL
jgi:quinol monooxygenase YgiN